MIAGLSANIQGRLSRNYSRKFGTMKRRERVNITPVMPVILPRPESATTSSSASLGPYFTDTEGNIHFAGSSNTMDESIATHVTVEASAKSSQKIILPKLPAGVKPPSKIIVINNSNRDAGPPKVHVINTSKAGSQAYDEESRKRRVMTGELHMPKNILPKPEPLMLKKKPVVFARPGERCPYPRLPLRSCQCPAMCSRSVVTSITWSKKRPRMDSKSTRKTISVQRSPSTSRCSPCL